MSLWQPTTAQAEFLRSPAKHRTLLGDRCVGKSWAGAAAAFLVAGENPGAAVGVFRANWHDLLGTSWAQLRRLLAAEVVRSERLLNGAAIVELTNGSRVFGCALSAHHPPISWVLDAAWLDEPADLEDLGLWDCVLDRVRRGPVGPNRAWVTGHCNRGDAVWKRFVANGQPGDFIGTIRAEEKIGL